MNKKPVDTYQSKKKQLKLSQRNLDMFEFKHGLTDGTEHTFVETGKKFGVTGTRIKQVVAHVEYELEKLS